MTSIPRLVIAAPSSGSGKTTVATGLMAAFRARGLSVSPHKVGPDFIDPSYHALATGRPGRNLDAYLCGEELIEPLFLHGARDADIAIVEGVMGLYDGATGCGELASTAQVAKLLQAPVILVVDAASMSRSVAALVHGFVTFDSEVRIAGIILNKVGSDTHEAILREHLAPLGIPVVGVVRRADVLAIPSRHLGLVPVAERAAEARATVAALGDLMARTVDVDALLSIARSVPSLAGAAWDEHVAVGGPVSGHAGARVPPTTVAVAAGAAFSFAYAETSELLLAAGLDVVPFDPLVDEVLPADTMAIYLGGGFPEIHADALTGNSRLRVEVATAAETAAVYAECGGLLYLCKSLDGRPMCGVVAADATMSPRLSLGYRTVEALFDTAVAGVGDVVRAHEFHRTTVEPTHGARPAWRVDGRFEGWSSGQQLLASYLHTHWAGH
ncbi:MAG: cobyrinate a,c-diamide synthase, partial [Mycobacteriales bacterium]